MGNLKYRFLFLLNFAYQWMQRKWCCGLRGCGAPSCDAAYGQSGVT